MISAIFLNTVIPIMAIFAKKLKNQLWGELVKIQEFTLVIIFCGYISKMIIKA